MIKQQRPAPTKVTTVETDLDVDARAQDVVDVPADLRLLVVHSEDGARRYVAVDVGRSIQGVEGDAVLACTEQE